MWYHDVVGEGRCPIVDTWWQTETGGHPDHPASRRDHRPQAGIGDTGPSSASSPSLVVDEREQPSRRAPPRRQSRASSTIHGRARCAPSMATISASSTPISPPIPGTLFLGRWRASATRTAISGSPAASTTCINVSGHRMGTAEIEIRARRPPPGRGIGRCRLSARHQGPGHLRLCHAQSRGASRATSWQCRAQCNGPARRSARSPRRT